MGIGIIRGYTVPQNDAKPVFHALNPCTPVHVYRRNLPHWRQDGATYFVTFRLADSIPKRVLLTWKHEDEIWLRANGLEGPLSDAAWKAAYYSLPKQMRHSFEKRIAHRLHIELDECHGSCLLRKAVVRKTVVDAVKHFDNDRWWVGDFVVMPNHVHCLVRPILSNQLENILGSVKGFTSTKLTKQDEKIGKLWQQENYDRLVRDRNELRIWRRYIQRNPEKAGLRQSEYTYHRCRWLDDMGKA
jgi:type I restriction enzyme R subunit